MGFYNTSDSKEVLLFLLLIVLILTNTGCSIFKVDHPDPELPEISESGKNTIGAIVNGEIWVPTSSLRKRATFQVENSLQISASIMNKKDGVDQSFTFIISNETIKVGAYQFDNILFESRSLTWNDGILNCLYRDGFSERLQYSGQVVISKVDKVNRIIAGTFSFNISMDGCPNISIEDGRFDFEYSN